jgi:hypothetical protein
MVFHLYSNLLGGAKMNCWKSINIYRDYGSLRLTLFSIIIMVTYFIVFYLLVSAFHHGKQFSEVGLLPFIIGLTIILPLHKLIHIIPLWLSGKKVEVILTSYKRFIPCFSFCCDEKLPRNVTIISMISPFIIFTGIAIIGSYTLPHLFHYFAIFSAINVGLSTIDFLYLSQLLKAPRHSIIENSNVGFDILINKN